MFKATAFQQRMFNIFQMIDFLKIFTLHDSAATEHLFLTFDAHTFLVRFRFELNSRSSVEHLLVE
jgi:hypothetical protein